MIVSAHQPHFLPWLGYFNKVACSDVFVWLEDVQFRKNYFQNRTKIKANKEELWLTLPVKKGKLEENINEVVIVKGREFSKLAKTLKNYYSKTPFFDVYFNDIETIISNSNDSLNDINFELFNYFIKVLNIKTKIIRSEHLNLEENDPNLRLLELCLQLKATKYIAGKGSRNYMNESLFNEIEVEILWQKFPIETINYPQTKGDFISGLSILDVLFNVGPEKAHELVISPWKN